MAGEGRVIGDFWKKWRIDPVRNGCWHSADSITGQSEPPTDRHAPRLLAFAVLMSGPGRIRNWGQSGSANSAKIFGAIRTRADELEKEWDRELESRPVRMAQPYEVLIGMKNLGEKTLRELAAALKWIGLKPPAWRPPTKPPKIRTIRSSKSRNMIDIW